MPAATMIFFNFERIHTHTHIHIHIYINIAEAKRDGRKLAATVVAKFNEMPVDILQFIQTRIPKALRNVVVIERNLAFFYFRIARVHRRTADSFDEIVYSVIY